MGLKGLTEQGGLIWAPLVVVIFLLGDFAQANARVDGYGPFPVRNFQPIQLLFLGMFGDRAAVMPQGSLDIQIELAETSAVFDEQSAQVSAQLKFETLRSAVLLRYGLMERLEVGVEIPVLYRYEGFLEGAITATEAATTGRGGARQRLEDIRYVFNVSRDGRTLFSGSEGDVGLGDITLIGKWQLLDQNHRIPTVSLRLGLKVPSGDEGRLFGSGHADIGIGVAAEKAVTKRWLFHGNINVVFPTGDVAGLAVDRIVSGIAAVEYLWTPNFSLVAQFDYYSTPFHGTGVKLLDRGVTEVTAGFSYRLREPLVWRVYAVENLDFIRDSAADFTVSTLIIYRFDM